MPGTLYLVATPIGNLEDITYRAVRLLKEADIIACEDTRHTRKLLAHFGVSKPLVSYHEHNEEQRAEELIERLREGKSVALVSDAGMPVVSDPGYRLVRRAAEEGIPVVPAPGPSAPLTALAASGLPSDRFTFLGFLPPRGAQRRETLRRIAEMDTTVILFEAPHRILATLDDLRQVAGDRPIVAAREMTKIHEEFLRGTAEEVREELARRNSIKGEFTIVIGKPPEEKAPEPDEGAIRAAVDEQTAAGVSRMEAIKAVARRFKLPKRRVYEIVAAEQGEDGES